MTNTKATPDSADQVGFFSWHAVELHALAVNVQYNAAVQMEDGTK